MEKYSFGIGDRFEKQGKYLLDAFCDIKRMGIDVTPVWNKSNREHKTVNSKPDSVRIEAQNAAEVLAWTEEYFVDADHVNRDLLDDYIRSADFFTIDVASKIGQTVDSNEKRRVFVRNESYIGKQNIEGVDLGSPITREVIDLVVDKFYQSILEVESCYQYIKDQKDAPFIIEVSMDEVDEAQSIAEFFFILKMLADHNIPVNNIAPKFTGDFYKGIDYAGDHRLFEIIFEQQLMIIKYAIKHFNLPADLKLSVHTGSDKYSLYPIINRLIKKHDIGIHLKTAGTTWLEEVIGLCRAGGPALELVKTISKNAIERFEELTGPYESVLDITRSALPTKEQLDSWSAEQYILALTHDPSNANYNPDFRQLIHTTYKIAAEHKQELVRLLEENEKLIGSHVKANILNKHLIPLFM